MVTVTSMAPANVRMISLGVARVREGVLTKPKSCNYHQRFTRETVENSLDDLRLEQVLQLADIKVLSVKKEERPELKFPGVLQEAKPLATIEIPLTVHHKVLEAIRIKLWDKGAGIAVRFEVNQYLPSSKLSADNDYLAIIEEEKKSRSTIII